MRSTWRTLLSQVDPGTRADIALVCAADALVGASFGAISVSGGLPGWVPVSLSLLVFAGGAQFAAVAVVLSGGSAVAGVVAGLVLNARLLPFGFAVADALGSRRAARWAGAHLVTDESVAFTLGQVDPARRRAAFWVCALGLFVSWNLAVLAGTLLGGLVSDTDALGLDAAFPAVLLALVVPALRDGGPRAAALLGALVAVLATPVLPPGLPVLAALAGLLVTLRGARVGRGAAADASPSPTPSPTSGARSGGSPDKSPGTGGS
ncbi:MAG: AzlC family ABC transporter permease [Nocardioidaceae bacterium]